MRIEALKEAIEGVHTFKVNGRVTRVVGMVIEGVGIGMALGEMCRIQPVEGPPLICEVVGFSEGRVFLMPLGETKGVGPGSPIERLGLEARVRLGEGVLGRILDGAGRPLDGRGPIARDREYDLYRAAPNPLARKRIREPLDVGVRAINGLLTVGCGQRMGIFAGSGVGKSVLLGMMARNTNADVNVIALIGERGREVKEFIEKDLKEEGLRRSVVVVATSDQSPLLRVRGAFLAMTIAEYFRDQGLHVLLLMDSLTRFAMAQREIGLAVGEPPATKGYPPSVFGLIPRLLERAGRAGGEGSITGFFTVLVEGDDVSSDPIGETCRAVLDGHIILSRDLASKGHYPAIDVLMSTSRCMRDVVSEDHWRKAQKMKALMATYAKNADLISIGAYKEGSDPEVDEAIRYMGRINGFLTQDIDEKVDFEKTLREMEGLGLEER